MFQNKILKNLRLYSLTAIFSCALFNLPHANAWGDPTVKGPSEDKVLQQVEKIQTLDEAIDALDRAQKSVLSYKTTLRQLYRGDYADMGAAEEQKAIEATKDLIRDEERKVSLLEAKIRRLEADAN